MHERVSEQSPTHVTMIALSITLRTQQATQIEFLSTMKGLVIQLRRSPGCVGCRLVSESETADAYTLIVEWDDRGAFEWFLQSRELMILQGMRLLLRDDPVATVDDVLTRTRVSLTQARTLSR